MRSSRETMGQRICERSRKCAGREIREMKGMDERWQTKFAARLDGLQMLVCFD